MATSSPTRTSDRALRLWLRRAELDRAVLFATMARLWSLLAAPLTLLLIARYLSPEVQGFYYTFASLLALQSFLELGFSLVITNVASHEWSLLGLDGGGRIAGDPGALSRLVSLGRLVFRWYVVAGALFITGVGSGGYVFLSRAKSASAIDWQAPWLTLVVLSGLLFLMTPFNALLEGCNQVEAIQRFRLGQSVIGTLGSWVALALGAGLWVAAVTMAVFVARDVYLILVQYKPFFGAFLKPPDGPRVDWRAEIWPMQWRLGLSGVVGYLTFSLFVPVMFRYHGPKAAGRMGMTLAVVNGLQALAHSWVQTKVPRFGVLIAREDYRALDRLFYHVLSVSLLVYACCAAPVWALICLLNGIGHPLAGRMLPPLPAGLLLLASVFMQLSYSMSSYFRAHKREPILALSVTSSLAMGLTVWGFGGRYGPVGAAASYLGVYVVVVVWEFVIWVRFRERWHHTRGEV